MPPMSLTIKLSNEKIITIEDKDRQPVEVWTRVMGYY